MTAVQLDPERSMCPTCRRPVLGGDYLAHFQARVLQDALTEATAAYWLRRARQFEDARPRAGDYPGTATATATTEARDQRLALTAQACRQRAALHQIGEAL